MRSNATFHVVAAAILTLATSGPAPAQPANDNCTDATSIAGFATFPFDSAGGSTDGLSDALCNFFSNNQIFNDVWYCWTAAASGPVGVRTCDQTALDTKIAVYDGCGCPSGSSILGCSDDDCGGPLQSAVTWAAVAGHSYLIRVGSYDQLDFGNGTLETFENVLGDIAGPFTLPGSDHMYFLLESSSWTAAEATAVARGGHLATVNDATENEFLRANVLGFDGADRRGWIGFNDIAVEGTFVWTSGEPITYTNWNGGEPNNSGGVEDVVEMFGSNGQWNDNRDTPTGLTVYRLVEIPAGTPCPGDFNQSGDVGLSDLTILLSNFGRTDNPGADHGDMDGDGDVDLSDLTEFLARFGTSCP